MPDPASSRPPGPRRYIALTLLTVLLLFISVSTWQHVRSRRARVWASEFPSVPRDRFHEVARTHSAGFTSGDWHYLGSEALRADTRFETWISANSGALPRLVRRFIPVRPGQPARWRAFRSAWTSSSRNLNERRESLLRLAVDAPPHLRWHAVELAIVEFRQRTPSGTNETSILTATLLDALGRLADDPDPLARTYVVLALAWSAPGQESRVNDLLMKFSNDPDPQVAETATRIRARKPPGWPTSQRERQGH